MATWFPRGSGLWNGISREGKRHVERRCGRRITADDVGANSNPIRREAGVADPRLQISREWHAGRSGCRHVEKIAAVNQNVRAEEIVTCRQHDRLLEHNGDLGLISGRRSLSLGPAGIWIDAVHYRIRDRDACRELIRHEPKRSVAAVARGSIDLDIRG